jgi:hypothetical protein
MKDNAPLGNPFIGEPRCGRQAKVGGHVAKSSPICPQGVVVEIKGKIVDGKEGIVAGRP